MFMDPAGTFRHRANMARISHRDNHRWATDNLPHVRVQILLDSLAIWLLSSCFSSQPSLACQDDTATRGI